MAVSRVQCLRRMMLLEPRVVGVMSSGSRLMSTEMGDAEAMKVVGGGGKVVGQELAMMRREYEKQMSELRKKYAAERERKEKEKRQVELVTRERIEAEKVKRLALKKEKSAIRAVEVAEEMKALRARLEEERKARAARRHFREKRFLRLVAKEKDSVRNQSSTWIEEKDLERRILDALVDPFYLSGSYALPDRDGPMSIGDDSDDDDE
ncbi:hypothetical protein M758_7G102700 [Ceratodon purpureus]|nr:hypothetical protein M758_7G102700 [Ceratodon purpureus]